MKETIEKLIADSQQELGIETMKAAGKPADDGIAVTYWATRVQTLMQVLELINKEEGILTTEVIQ